MAIYANDTTASGGPDYENILRALQVANTAGKMDLGTLIGYGIGSMAKNYIQTGRSRGAQSVQDPMDQQNATTTGQGASAQNTTTYASDPSQAYGAPSLMGPAQNLGTVGTSSGQQAMDSAVQNGTAQAAQKLFNGGLGASDTANQMGQAGAQANQAAMQGNGVQAQQAALQQQATAANQQNLAEQQKKNQLLGNLALMAATGGFGGGGGTAASGVGSTSLTAQTPGLLGNVSGKWFPFPDAATGSAASTAASTAVPAAASEAVESALSLPQVAQQVVQAAQNTQAQQRPMDYVSRQLAQQLIAAKQAYAGAQAQNDAAGMQRAAAAAQSVRNTAAANGINLDGYGASNSLQEAAQNFQNDTYRGVNNILNHDMTSDEYYNAVYKNVRKAGYTDTEARNEAYRRAGIYQAQRMARLSSAFANYGTNANGSVNNVGVQILAAMGNENPTTANFYANNYGSPKDDYHFGQQIGLQNNQAANQLQNGLAMDKDKFQYNEQSANNNVGRQIAVHQAAAQAAEYYKNLGWQDRVNMTARYLMQAGVPADQAIQQAIGAAGGRGSGGSSGGGRGTGTGSEKGRNGVSDTNYNAAMKTIDDKLKYDKDHSDSSGKITGNNPYSGAYEQARDTVDRYWQQNLDPDDYNSSMSWATYMLEQNNAEGNKWSQSQLQDYFKQKLGDNADEVISDIDWGKYF